MTPLDFTRPLELDDGTEAICTPAASNIEGCYFVRAGRAGFYINKFGRDWADPTGPQIVRNRVEEARQGGQTNEEAFRIAYARKIAARTPAAPEPDGEVVDWLTIARSAGKYGVRYSTNSNLLAFVAEAFPKLAAPSGEGLTGELAGIVECMDQMLADPKLDALAFDKHDSRIIREALRALTPPSPSSATPVEGMVERVAEALAITDGHHFTSYKDMAETAVAIVSATIRQEAMEDERATVVKWLRLRDPFSEQVSRVSAELANEIERGQHAAKIGSAGNVG